MLQRPQVIRPLVASIFTSSASTTSASKAQRSSGCQVVPPTRFFSWKKLNDCHLRDIGAGHFLNVWNSSLDSQQWLLSPSQSSTANQEMMTVKCLRWGGEWIFEDVEWMQCIRWEPWSEYLWMLKSTWGAPPSVETDRQDIWKSSSTSSLIGTEGALRLPTTYDKNPIPSNPIHPSNPHIALRTTSPLKIWSNQSNQYNWSNRPNQSNRSNRCTRQWLWRWRSVKDSIA